MSTEQARIFLDPNILLTSFTEEELELYNEPSIDVSCSIARAKTIAEITKTPEDEILRALLAVSALRFFYDKFDPKTQKSMLCWFLNNNAPDSKNSLNVIAFAVSEINNNSEEHASIYPNLLDIALISQAISAINQPENSELRLLFRLMIVDQLSQINESDDIPKQIELMKTQVNWSINHGIPLEEMYERISALYKLSSLDKDCITAIYYFYAIHTLMSEELRSAMSSENFEMMIHTLKRFGFTDSGIDELTRYKAPKQLSEVKRKEHKPTMKPTLKNQWTDIAAEIEKHGKDISDENIQRIVDKTPDKITEQLFYDNRTKFMSVIDIFLRLKLITLSHPRGAKYLRNRKCFMNAVDEGKFTGIRWIYLLDRKVMLEIQFKALEKILAEHPEYLES